jgi:hypothetical protein
MPELTMLNPDCLPREIGWWGLRILPVALAGFLLVSPVAATAQIPVVRLPEPGAALEERITARMPGALSWSQKREILQQNRIVAPPQPPSEFALTPRAPHRLPGGYLSVGIGLMVATRWNPSAPNNTGSVSLSQVNVLLSGLRGNTNYLFDLFVQGISGTKLTVKSTCHYGGGGSTAGEFPLNGSGHVFVVMPTDANGGGCFQLQAASSAMLFRIEASELGPVR